MILKTLAGYPDYARAAHLPLVTLLGSERYLPSARLFLNAVQRPPGFQWSESLIDLLSIYRDALVVHTGAPIGLVNQDMFVQVERLSQLMSPERLLQAMDAIGTARERIDANVHPLLALEAMAISLQLPH